MGVNQDHPCVCDGQGFHRRATGRVEGVKESADVTFHGGVLGGIDFGIHLDFCLSIGLGFCGLASFSEIRATNRTH